jgi:hypothetical protein
VPFPGKGKGNQMTNQEPLPPFPNQIEEFSRTAEKLSFLSGELGHKLAYFVIGLQTAICGYLLYNSDRFSCINLLEYIFLSIGFSVFFGLLWLAFYSLNIHFAGSFLTTSMYFQKWMVNRSSYDPLPSVEKYEEEFNKECRGLLKKAKRNQKRAASGIWVFAQYLFYGLFFSCSLIAFAWLVFAGFQFLHSNNCLPRSVSWHFLN